MEREKKSGVGGDLARLNGRSPSGDFKWVDVSVELHGEVKARWNLGSHSIYIIIQKVRLLSGNQQRRLD